MHWANQTAEWLIENHKSEEIMVCASGISPSGHVHIGNFREVITTHFVVEALKARGVKTRFIFSWDDYDRFRKVPSGLPEYFSNFIGMPYSKVPDPFGCHESYAAHFESEFEEALAAFDIHPEFIYQSQMYQSGAYTDAIREALINRSQIYDIINAFKTQDWSEEERQRFYPINLYCRVCGKDSMKHMHYDMDDDSLEYTCACGHHEIAELEGFNRVKLTWKVDWPMRWRHENVVFEPGGRDHSSENGSFSVSKEIATKIFSRPAPHYIPYEFIGLKGNSAKMSSSSGHLITPAELLKVYPKEIILFLFAKYHHNDAFDIGLDEDINRLYTEYERYLAKLHSQSGVMQEILSFTMAEKSHIHQAPKFSSIAQTLPLLNFNRPILMDLLPDYDFTNPDVLAAFHQKCDHAQYWLRVLNTGRLTHIQDTFNINQFRKLDSVERGWLNTLCDQITAGEYTSLDADAVLQRVYDVVLHDDPSIRRKLQKRFFEIIYTMVLAQTSGPQIGVLLKVVGESRMLELLRHQEGYVSQLVGA